ncbi:MAG: hypothetical protein U0235_06290 [Polyangiaceae bacterium]
MRELVQVADRGATHARAQADQAGTLTGAALRTVLERAGAAQAVLELRKEQLHEREEKAGVKEAHARDLRRQIDELRAQLARYAEALEEDLAQGREKVAARTREGLGFEKAFNEASVLLLNHLKGKAEVRDLLQELMENMHGGAQHHPPTAANRGESRGPQ